MNIAVCSLTIGAEYKHVVRHCTRSLKIYCHEHNYPLITDETKAIHDRDYMWSKIPLLREILPKYDYVVWIDGDMMIMNKDIKLERFIELYLGNKETMMCTDCGGQINTGFWILKNSQYCKDLLDIIENLPELAGRFHEQGVYNELYAKNLFQLRQRSRILEENEQRLCNATMYNYVQGDFLIHFLGIREWNKLAKIDRDHYPYLKEDEDDHYAHFLRTKWMRDVYGKQKNFRYIICLPKVKVEVCTFYTGDKYTDDVIHYGQKSMKIYCEKHNYKYHVQTESLVPELPPHWTKFALLLKIMRISDSDYIVWMDADIMIMTHSIKIEQVIEENMNGKDFLLCRDVSGEINTGVCIIRNTEYSQKMLELMLNIPELRYRGYEDQDIFNRVYQRNIMDFKNRSTILHQDKQRVMNSCILLWKWGDWLIHFFSLSKDGLKKAFSDFYPLCKEYENDENYSDRLNWIKNR